MKECEFEDIWEIMNNYNFQIIQKISTDLTCILCRKLLIDARICPCGCRFCKKCIIEYLSKGNDICPGKRNECEDERLELNLNVWIDHIVNRKIINVQVRCPIEMCSYQDSVKEIGEHIKGCNKLSIKCPYNYLGCDRKTLDGADLSNHLKLDKDKHIQMMISKIENMNSESQSLRSEIKSLQEESYQKQVHIEQVQKQLENMKNCFNSKLDEIINNQMEEQKRLQIDLEDKQKEIDEMKLKFNEYFSANLKEFKCQFSKLSGLVETRNRVYSDEFYTHPNGYKLRIEVDYGKKYKIYLQMVNGDYNKVKDWPIQLEVTLGIFNETSQEFHMSDKRVIEYMASDELVSEFLSFSMSEIPASSITYDTLSIKCLVKVII